MRRKSGEEENEDVTASSPSSIPRARGVMLLILINMNDERCFLRTPHFPVAAVLQDEEDGDEDA